MTALKLYKHVLLTLISKRFVKMQNILRKQKAKKTIKQ